MIHRVQFQIFPHTPLLREAKIIHDGHLVGNMGDNDVLLIPSSVSGKGLDGFIVYPHEFYREIRQGFELGYQIYFAGEHSSILSEVPGTMEAACESGERVARAILNHIAAARVREP